jgi:ribosomal protein L11 methyltransferase
MSWAEVSLSIPRGLADRAEAALEELGALAITLQDHADVPVLEPAPGTAPLWPVVQVRGLFPSEVNRGEVSAALLRLAGITRPDELVWREVADQDWERAWMDRFQPMQFGAHLWIVPSGMQAPSDPAAVILHLDPGLAFGTGTHATTALCLEWIDAHRFTGLRVMDYGCGSGVLGIATALKGARRVVCVDNDPQALQATTDNAVRNRCAGRMECRPPAGNPTRASSGQYDVVLANILAGPLIELAPGLAGSLAPGGHIVLSGVLEDQAEHVAAAYSGFCGRMQVREKDGWVLLHGSLPTREGTP